jgi:ketosteroid isomerase-like protein
MSDESTTPELVELTRGVFEAFSSGNLEAGLSRYAPDAVYQSAALGTVFDGRSAIRGFMQEWTAAYEEFEMQPEEILELGGGITFSTVRQRGRPLGITGSVEWRFAAVAVWSDGSIVRAITYDDIDEGRAAAERLAAERG